MAAGHKTLIHDCNNNNNNNNQSVEGEVNTAFLVASASKINKGSVTHFANLIS